MAFVLTLRVLVYKLGDGLLRQRIAQMRQTVSDQKGRPTELLTLLRKFDGLALQHTQ